MAYFAQSPVLWPEFDGRDYIIRCSRCLLRLPIWPNPWVFMHYTCKCTWLDNYIITINCTAYSKNILIDFTGLNKRNTWKALWILH